MVIEAFSCFSLMHFPSWPHVPPLFKKRPSRGKRWSLKWFCPPHPHNIFKTLEYVRIKMRLWKTIGGYHWFKPYCLWKMWSYPTIFAPDVCLFDSMGAEVGKPVCWGWKQTAFSTEPETAETSRKEMCSGKFPKKEMCSGKFLVFQRLLIFIKNMNNVT